MTHTVIDGEVIRTTERAILVMNDSGRETWIPRSVCIDGDDIGEGDEGIEVADWFVEKEDL